MGQLTNNSDLISNYNHDSNEINIKEMLFTVLNYKFRIIIFVFIITLLTLLYLLSKPNIYKSEVILIPQVSEKKMSSGLSSLASLAGLNLGFNNSSKDPYLMMEITLGDYEFNKYMIKKYDLANKILNQKNKVYAFGLDFFGSDTIAEKDISNENLIFKLYKRLNNIVSISKEKSTNSITLSVTLNDRFFAKELVDIYLEEIIEKVKKQDMKEIDKQIIYYKKELSSTYDVSLKEELSKSLSTLVQKKVLSLANDYYFVSKVSNSRIPHISEKIGPKRAIFLLGSFILSLVISIVFILGYEFIKRELNDKKA